ncbi:MAG: 3'-5' exonuclease [Pseudolabrys sp.]
MSDKTDDEIREVMGDKFPKHIYHSIVCIGALIAHREDDKWAVDAIGAPHIGERSEKELVQGFVDKIADLNPQLVTFNGNSFDLPVLRYRAMVNCVVHRDYLPGPISIDIPTTRLTYVTFSLPLHRKRKQRCMRFAKSWDCLENLPASMAARLRAIVLRAKSRKSLTIVKRISSIPIGFGCDTSCFVGD